VLHRFWCNISLKKNSHFPAKYRKQTVGIFRAFQIYGSKGSYGQNLGNIGVIVASVIRTRVRASAARSEGQVVKDLSYLIDN
jgi:hypothetical protein